jgi:hypothetical protein
MKPEFRIDISEGAISPLEALHVLSVLDPKEGFHISKNLRPPLGIYNISISRVCDKLIKFCDRLEKYFKTSKKIDVLRVMDDLRQEVIDYLELSLYAAEEHVDDISLIAKGFFDDNKKYKKSKIVSQLEGSIKKHKSLISSSINAIKHHQARIRIFSMQIQHASIDHCLHGYFIEGVHDGVVGPNKIFHDNSRQVISVTSLIWEIICFILNSSRQLSKFLKNVRAVSTSENQTKNNIFSKAIIAAARLPIYSFDEKHPFSETRIILNADEHGHKLLDSKIYGSITHRWLKSNDMMFLGDTASYEGDGVTKSFQLVKPKTLGLQHWD